MRILVANKFWYPRGGLERVMFDEIEWLEAAGHEVAHFSTAHPDNEPSPWASFFPDYIELGSQGRISATSKARAVARMFHNGHARRLFAAELDTFEPDIVHVHGIHRQISPSILLEAHGRGIPVVQSLHDYHHLCPNDVLLRGKRVVCEPALCSSRNYLPAITNRCIQNSLAASAISAGETGWQRATRSYERSVTRFISPSHFLSERMTSDGWRVPIDVIPNALPVANLPRNDLGGFLVAGRLSEEKGVEQALEAARRAKVSIVVAGDGPLRERLHAAYPEARFLGRVDGPTVARLMSECRAVVIPSLWYENAPMSVLEAMAVGAPVIASAIGGIVEQVRPGRDGLLVEPGNISALVDAMSRLAQDAGLVAEMGTAGRQRVAECFSPERHVELLLQTYQLTGREHQ